jgi:hypothetical protein
VAAETVPSLEQAFGGQSPEGIAQELWQRMVTQHPLEMGLVFLVLGLVFLLYGYKLYKILVSVVFAGIGGMVGVLIGVHFGAPGWLIGLIGAIVLGILAWPLFRIGWGILGGAIFGAIALPLAVAMTNSPVLGYTLAAVAFIAGMVLTIVLMRPLIIISTSISGAATLVEGVLLMLIRWPSAGDPVRAELESKPYLFVVLVALPAILGAILQWRDTAGAKPAAKKSARKADDDDE